MKPLVLFISDWSTYKSIWFIVCACLTPLFIWVVLRTIIGTFKEVINAIIKRTWDNDVTGGVLGCILYTVVGGTFLVLFLLDYFFGLGLLDTKL